MHKIIRLLRYDWPLHFVLLLTNWLPDNVIFLQLRGALARLFLGSCGQNLRLGRNITFYNPSKITFGKDVYVAYGCWFMAGAQIAIGDEVLIGPYCVIVSSNHQQEGSSFRFGNSTQKPIQIGFGSWLGSHVTVTAGTIVGRSCQVAANAVLTDEYPDNVLLGGVPARIIKHLDGALEN